MVEITISDAEKQLLENSGLKNVISNCLLLSYGNIKDLLNMSFKKNW